MPRPDGRIEPGQPLAGAISARAWNRAQDAADIVLGESLGAEAQSGGSGLKPYTWAYCKSSATVARWGVLAISGVEITPASTESDTATRSFQDCPVLAGGTPSAGTTAWCVAIEPIEGGKIGRVAVAGVVQCKVNVVNENDCYAVCSTTTAALKSAQSGEGQILWKQAGTGDGKWALVRIGHDRQLARGTFTGDWQASSPKTITDSVDSSVTYQVKNTLGDLRMAGGNTNCLITLISGEWYLVSFDLNKLYGKSSSQTQLLGHVQGTLALQWIDTTSCQ